MKIITNSNKYIVSISQTDWILIGEQNNWLKKTARNKGFGNLQILNSTEEINNIINSFGSKRFYIEFRKKDGSLRTMHAQRYVNKYKMNELQDPGASNLIRERGMILLYDLDVASQMARKIPNNDNEYFNKNKEKQLQKSYRRIYPQTVEYIKIGNNEYVNGFLSNLDSSNQELLN